LKHNEQRNSPDRAVSAVRQEHLHPHRVPKATPLGWVSNAKLSMVSIDLDGDQRKSAYAKRMLIAEESHATWAGRRIASNLSLGKQAIPDSRTQAQFFASYKVKEHCFAAAELSLLKEMVKIHAKETRRDNHS
jgi:hypothetical protein